MFDEDPIAEEDQVADDHLDMEKELAKFAAEEAKKLGLGRENYTEEVHREFWASQRAHTTVLLGGLTVAHDEMLAASLRGIGYVTEHMEVPTTDALQVGKEFGNRGQCNPTYFTVGNLVMHLQHLRDNEGMSTQDIIEGYLFVTAGACGPCRFGTYVTEYRKALRDAGFDGFRVMLFQQQGGLKQATGREVGLKIDSTFGLAIIRAFMVGDVINLIGYRLRPYEVVPGSTNIALKECKALAMKAFASGGNVHLALLKSRRILGKVEVDRSVAKPLVSIIGEFWAMTTEGDGNYHLQRFLEKEGAEVDVQTVTNWILFMIWENRYDTEQRMALREEDEGTRKALKGKDAAKKLWGLAAADKVIRTAFHSYAKAIGLHGHVLPDMDEIAELSEEHYDNFVRGGEAHMEVGKVIHFAQDNLNHMTLSVKPFGCMPSSGVSDGIQSVVTQRHPTAIFLPIETTGDGEVNVHSRIQMMLFKARQVAREELDKALTDNDMDLATFQDRLRGSRRWRNAFLQPPHRVAGRAANLAYAIGR
jgi:predicted nucleotide-binding protein (sugar kinase/HSP70/actin superfamily)